MPPVLFPAPDLIGLLMDLNVPKGSFRHVSEFMPHGGGGHVHRRHKAMQHAMRRGQEASNVVCISPLLTKVFTHLAWNKLCEAQQMVVHTTETCHDNSLEIWILVKGLTKLC